MSSTKTITHTVIASGAGVQDRFVTFTGAQAGAADKVLGVAITDFAAGAALALHIIGVCTVEAGGAINVGDPVVPDAQGRGIAGAADAANIVGRALSAVTAAGQTLFIMIK